ncbi:MAG: sulfotransferase [Pseudomonadota bacterium]
MSVVFLCVGAAKAGTSWLHRQLSAHPDCHFRAIKELHYFDAIDGGRLHKELQKHRKWQEAELEKVARSGLGPSASQAVKLADRGAWLDVLERQDEDLAAYLAYLQSGARDAKVVGEMTPAYALLSHARLERMAHMAPDVRFLYLLRDPVERLWSHVRMIASRRDQTGQVRAESCAAILNRTVGGDETEIVKRSDYVGALRRLTAAVPATRLLIEVFEDVVRRDGLHRICDFLGIGRIAADPSPVHAGRTLAMTDPQRKLATRWLAPQYAAAEAALGRRPDGWSQGGWT